MRSIINIHQITELDSRYNRHGYALVLFIKVKERDYQNVNLNETSLERLFNKVNLD
jgi:hypothetical protein